MDRTKKIKMIKERLNLLIVKMGDRKFENLGCLYADQNYEFSKETIAGWILSINNYNAEGYRQLMHIANELWRLASEKDKA